MTTEQFKVIHQALSESKLTKSQWDELSKLLKEKKKEVVGVKGTHGVHITKAESDGLDADILRGLSQKEICHKYSISPTTFKRHRKKLLEQGHSIKIKTNTKAEQIESIEVYEGLDLLDVNDPIVPLSPHIPIPTPTPQETDLEMHRKHLEIQNNLYKKREQLKHGTKHTVVNWLSV